VKSEKYLIEREGPDGTQWYADDHVCFWTKNWRQGDSFEWGEALQQTREWHGSICRELSQVEDEQRFDGAPAMSATWTVQSGSVFYGQEVVTYKSNNGEWAYGYGTELGDTLAVETIVTGFTSEDEAFRAASWHCYEVAEERALDVSA